MPAQTRIYQYARARLRIGLCGPLFRPTASVESIARSHRRVLRSKSNAARDNTGATRRHQRGRRAKCAPRGRRDAPAATQNRSTNRNRAAGRRADSDAVSSGVIASTSARQRRGAHRYANYGAPPPPPPTAWPRPQAPRPPPGRDIRVGAWTPQEVAYATRVADLYRAGSLPNVPDGITLRILLSKLLNCQPMRVSTCVEINQCVGCTR